MLQRQYWRAYAYIMHLHENRYIKRAGVAGIALRARGANMYAEAAPAARRRARLLWVNPNR